MEAATRRRVRSGKEYDHLFSRPNGKDTLIKKSADVSDTVSFIQRIVPLTLSDTAKVAKVLKEKRLGETCRNYWQFVFDHIPYHRDKDGVEQVRRPARTWWDRKHPNEEGNVGVDCDCYTVFLSSMLMNAGIPHKYRIAKYPKRPPEVAHWQHIYIVVPKDGKLDHNLESRDDYIVMDCVKNNYDDEQPYLEVKDYTMRLDYLNGFEEEYKTPKTVDEQAMAALNEDEDDLGKLQVGKAIKKGLHTLNRYTNPGTILLRNGFLLIMKENLFGVAKKLRYAYVTDNQAAQLGMNLNALSKLRKVKDRAETIYFQAGGKKENLRKAILSGKGNRDKKVPLSGLRGLSDIYADQDEYNIINSISGLGELGDPVSGSAIAAATSAISAIAGALKQVKGLFKPGTPGAKEMDAASTLPTSTNSNSNDITTTDSSAEPTVSNQSGGSNASLLPAPTSDETSTQVTTANGQKEKGGVITWAKANPMLATGIVAGVATGAYFIFKKKEARGNLNGLSGRRKKRKSKPKTSKYKAVRIK